MRVQPIRIHREPTIEELKAQLEHHEPKPPIEPTFEGYNFKLKKLFRQGKLPKDLVDIGGNKITQRNLSGDHIIPRSKGGKNTDDNMMIATKQFNSLRGNRPLKEVVTLDNVIKWALKMMDIKVDGFDGVQHVKDVFKALDKNIDILA